MLWIMFDKYLRGEQWGNHNSARPKVPRRDSLGAGPIDSNNPLFTGTASALGWGHVRSGQAAKNCTCTTSSKCIVSIRHGRNKPTRPQLGHTWPNFGPTWLQDGARNKFGPSWGPYASKWTTSRPNLKSSKYPFSLVFFTFFAINDASFERVPSCTTVDVTWTSMCITLLLLGVHLHRFGPNFGRPSLAPLGAGRAQVRPNPSQFCGPNATRWKLIFLPLFPTFFWLSWAQLWHQMPPHRTMARMLSPTCVQTCPSCAMLVPSRAQVGPKMEPTGPSSAQVTPKLSPSGLLFGPA